MLSLAGHTPITGKERNAGLDLTSLRKLLQNASRETYETAYVY